MFAIHRVWILALIVVVPLAAHAQTSQPASAPLPAAMRGRGLTAAQVEQLEEKVKANPDDLDSRIALLGYYFGARTKSRADHALWIIEHHPEHEFTASPECSIDGILDAANFAKARELWLKHTDGKFKNDPQVLANAAGFFVVNDSELALKLLKRAIELDPASAEWAERLGHQYHLKMLGIGGAVNAEYAKRALESYELAIKLSPADERADHYEDAAECAYFAGEMAKAESYAKLLLDSAIEGGPGGRWNYGNIVHKGNLILGLVAVRNDKLDDAEAYLLKAGQTPGSPQLNSFGPNMYLALELLKKDRKAKVIEYLKLCKKFWARPELDKWIAAIEAGRTPDFGGNLRY